MTTQSSELLSFTEPLAKNRWPIVIAVMVAATLEVLDTTIVNIALPDMMGTFGTTASQITWIITSYVVACAIVIPLTGFIADRIGRKQLILISTTGFMITSMLCGLTSNFSIMIALRILQGAFGATLVPLSQSILRDTFPKEQHSKAMAIWGIGIMVAPILGPTLGGYITTYFSWPWIFYVNLPICLLSLFLVVFFVPESVKKMRKIDWKGLMLMIMGIGCLQVFLDKGNEEGWLSSNFILLMLIMAIVTLSVFIFRSWKQKNSIVKVQLFKDSHFTLSTILLTLYCAGLFSLLILQPLMMERLFNYPTLTTGFLMAPRGLASAIGMGVTPWLLKRVGSKPVLIIGLLTCAFGTYQMSQYGFQLDMASLIWPSLYQGFGMGLFFVAISSTVFANLPRRVNTEASGLFSYGRMLGTSVGIAVISTLFSRQAQINWHQLSTHITAFNPNFHHWLSQQQLTLHTPTTISRLTETVSQQASMMAYIHCYGIIAWMFIALIIPVLLMRNVRQSATIRLTDQKAN